MLPKIIKSRGKTVSSGDCRRDYRRAGERSKGGACPRELCLFDSRFWPFFISMMLIANISPDILTSYKYKQYPSSHRVGSQPLKSCRLFILTLLPKQSAQPSLLSLMNFEYTFFPAKNPSQSSSAAAIHLGLVGTG
jgi:hypothetical protein